MRFNTNQSKTGQICPKIMQLKLNIQSFKLLLTSSSFTWQALASSLVEFSVNTVGSFCFLFLRRKKKKEKNN